MGYYIGRDIEVDDAGEIQVEHGALKLARTRRSYLQVLHWLILCNAGDVHDPDTVANLTQYVGDLNVAVTHRRMEDSVRFGVVNQKAFVLEDLRIRVGPVDLNEAALTVRLGGQYFLDEDEGEDEGLQTLAYEIPFSTALPVKVNIPES